jgi:hypothetical protein
MKQAEINKEDISLEEITLQGIISSCENLLDDLEQGANIEEKDMQDLVYADNVILDIQQRVSKQITPSNLPQAFYLTNVFLGCILFLLFVLFIVNLGED